MTSLLLGALEAAAATRSNGDDSHAALASPLLLLRALHTALQLGTLSLSDDATAGRVLNALAQLHFAARSEPDVLAAAAAGLSIAPRDAVLRWYAVASTDDAGTCPLPAVLTCAALALSDAHGKPRAAAQPAGAHVLRAAHVTLEGLRPPCAVFGQEVVDGAAADAFAAAATQRLALLPLLLALLPRAQLFPPHLARDQEVGWPPGGEGTEDGGPHPGPAVAVAACSFAGGASLDADAPACEGLPAWSSAPAAAAAQGALAWLHSAAAGEGPLRDLDVEALLAASLAARAPVLRRSLLVPDIGAPYSADAPTGYDADVAAQCLRSVASRLGHPAATDVLPAAFPCLLLALEHTAAAPRLHGQQAARHFAGAATRTCWRARAGVLWPALLGGLLACEDRAWPPAVAAAAACAHALGGDDAAAKPYHELLASLLTEVGRLPADARRALPVLRVAAPLVRVMGLQLLRHTKRLLPLLLEWLVAPEHDEHRMLAAEALTAALERIWPRASYHAPTLWPALLQAYALSARSAHVVATQAALLRVAEQLHFAAGAAFAELWMASEQQGSGATSLEVAPLFLRLRELADAAPSVVREPDAPQKQAAEEPADEPAASEEDRCQRPHPLVAPFDASCWSADEDAQHDFVQLPAGCDLDALLDGDAHVTAVLDAWSAGDTEVLQLATLQVRDDEPPLEALDDDAEGELQSWLGELALDSGRARSGADVAR